MEDAVENSEDCYEFKYIKNLYLQKLQIIKLSILCMI